MRAIDARSQVSCALCAALYAYIHHHKHKQNKLSCARAQHERQRGVAHGLDKSATDVDCGDRLLGISRAKSHGFCVATKTVGCRARRDYGDKGGGFNRRGVGA